jgi:Heparinase II/III-like protein
MKRGVTRRELLWRLALSHAACVSAFPQQTEQHPEVDPFRQLHPGHPRLILLDADFDRIRLLVRESAGAKHIYGDLEKECDRLLSIPPVEYKLVGTRLQIQTRRAIDRITSLSLMYRLSGKDSWLHRAMLEMNAAASFKDWNPGRLIDTAEMACAFAIGYDWLYNTLTPEERGTVRDAIVTKALDPVLPVYQRPGAWTGNRPAHWNLVCNAAFGMAAMAVAEDSPDKSTLVMRGVLESAPHGMQLYGPEGAWPEGPSNADYAMRYACLLLASLTTAMGSDNGLSSTRGFDRAGRFRVYTTGPANRTSNFAGAPEDPGTAPELFWLSRRFSSPTLAGIEQKQADRAPHADPLDLAWFERDAKAPQPPSWPLDALFKSVQVASFRSSWEDQNALFLAVKGGDNKAGRAHLDLGSFVLDAGGVRWAMDPDLGDSAPLPPPLVVPGQPAMPATANVPASNPALIPASWVTRTEAHNTLLIDNENQDSRAEAAITHNEFAPDLTWVQIDLSKSNGAKLRQWIRRIGLLQRQAVLVHDVVRSAQPVEVVWGMVTDADISLNGPAAVLKKGGWNLALEIRTPRHAVFDTVLTGPSLKKLVVRLGDKTADLDLSILMTPYRDGQAKPKITGQFPDLMIAALPAR